MPAVLARADPLAGVEGRGIEELRVLLAVAPFAVGEGVHAEVGEADELHLLPGDLLRRGGNVGRLAEDLRRHFAGRSGRRDGNAETDQNMCDAGDRLRHGNDSRWTIGDWVGFGQDSQYDMLFQLRFQPLFFQTPHNTSVGAAVVLLHLATGGSTTALP